MRKKIEIAGLVGVLMSLFLVSIAISQPDEDLDKTLSPYFLVKSDDPSIDQLPLKSTSADVNIAGVIADIKVVQVYENEGERPLEAIYVFPASTRAAVYGMKMTIGERTIIAEIKGREEAQREYQEARDSGKSASLLEQQRPNVFQMNVANILPNDKIKVELSYTELLVPTDGVYEFIYPTVVGPRYSNTPARTAPPQDRFVQTPYTREGEPPTYKFDIKVNLSCGLPIQEIICKTHKVNIEHSGENKASIKLLPSEEFGGNRDYILKYRLSGGQIESGVLLFEGKDENFFLLMVQPPKRIITDQIPPREYIFIVDVSGSMRGFPLEISKRLLRDLIANLKPTDTFNVLLFSGGSSVMSPQSLPATSENIKRAIELIEDQQGGGGTELLPALERALALPQSKGGSRTVVIATDGYVHVEKEAFDLIRHNLNRANMFTFGIGSSVNRYLIEGMARVGMGEPFVITKPEEAPSSAERFRRYIEAPLLTGIKVDFGGLSVYDVEPTSIPDLFAKRPVIIFGKWKKKLEGKITLSGYSGGRPYRATIDLSGIHPSPLNAGLRYLWARHRIAILDDYNCLQQDDERIEEVTKLGLTYNLLTAYTSFVAIDTQIRQDPTTGKLETVKQVLPLPEGVPDTAIGGDCYSTAGKRIKESIKNSSLESKCAELASSSKKKDQTTSTERTTDEKPKSIHVKAVLIPLLGLLLLIVVLSKVF